MSEFERVWYDFIYSGDTEEIFIKPKKYRNEEYLNFNVNRLGTCFCSLLNSKNELIKFKDNFVKKYKNKYNREITYSHISKKIVEIFNELKDFNFYFYIIINDYSKIFDCLNNYVENDLYDFWVTYTCNILEKTINTITSFEDFHSKKNPTDSFYIPGFSYNEYYNYNTQEYFSAHTYEINNFSELLSVSYYLIKRQKYHLKRCKLCGKYFVASRGQTRFCDNPCLTNPNETCRSIRKTQNLDNIKQKPWEIELDNLTPAVNASRQFFTDRIKRTNNQREKNMLLHNKNKYTSTINELKKIIKGASEKDLNTYLTIYKDFVNDVRNNQKNHESPILVIKKPRYKGFKK